MAHEKDPLSEAAWKGRINSCRQIRRQMYTTWSDNVAYRRGQPFRVTPSEDVINVPADWSKTQNKQAQLWYQLPEVKLEPRRDEWRSAAPIFAAALNFELSEHVHAEHMMNECMGDVINAAGIAIAKVGYDATFEEVDVPAIDTSMMDPQQLAMMQAEGQIPMTKAPQTVYQCYYTDRISPAHFLWPHEFVGSDWQKANWLGWEGYVRLAEAKRREWVDDSFEGGPIEDKEWLLIKDTSDQKSTDGWVKFCEIFYRPSAFDPAEKDHRKIKRLIIIENKDGEKSKVVDEDLPWQKYDPQTRKWIGMTTFPIKVMTISKISDLAIPPSNSEMGRPQVKEMIRARTQMIKQRDHSLPLRWFDVNQVDDEIADRLRKGKYQDMIPMNGPGDNAIGEVARASFPKETFEFMRIAQQDLDEAWSMGAPQQSVPTPGDTTATEIKQMTTSLNVRMEFERGWVLRFFLEVAQGVASLMQMFQDDTEYAMVVGDDGMQSLKAWNRHTIPGEYVFSIKPDSQLKLDAGQKRVEALNMYKLLRQDPLINPTVVLSEVLEVHGMDPSKILVPQQPPKPEKPKISYSFKGEDMASPFVVALIQKQDDSPVTPQDIEAAKQLIMASASLEPPMPAGQPTPGGNEPNPGEGGGPPTGQSAPHPGPSESVQPLNKRYEQSGNMTGAAGSRDSGIPTPQK